MRPRGSTAAALAALLCAATACAGPSGIAQVAAGSAPTTTHAFGDAPQPQPGDAWPATGALFPGPADDLGNHFCTASVIDSRARDVVITAAHCVATGDGTPPRTGLSFVPGYHDHVEPFGVWTVTGAVVDPAWQATGDPAHDVAFLTVGREGDGPIEDLTGGYQLILGVGDPTPVDAIGYPDVDEAPTVRSGTTTRFSPTQLQLAAPGLYDGTSGGPWLRGGTDVIAVTGGYEQGGSTPDMSYASFLDDAAERLLDQLEPES